VSGRNKKLRKQVINQMLAKKISVPEARARDAWLKTGRYQPPRQAPAAAKAVVPEKFKVNEAHQALVDAGPAAMAAWHARQVLRAAAAESCNPNIRENIRPGKGAV
jgi:hypothetical protein